MDAIRKECLWNKWVFAPKFLWKIKASEIVFRLILSEKNGLPTKTMHQLSINDVKMSLLTGKIRKAYKFRNCFCLHDLRNFRYFLKLETWRAAKLRACLICFSALNGIHIMINWHLLKQDISLRSCVFLLTDEYCFLAFESLYGGQFTLSTQLIKPNYIVILPTDAAPQFL